MSTVRFRSEAVDMFSQLHVLQEADSLLTSEVTISFLDIVVIKIFNFLLNSKAQ
jgi:hypothetical protein